MAFKFVLFVACACAATANAGLALTSSSDNTYRSLGNLAQVSSQRKTIETPYSSSSQSDHRVSNPSVYVTAQPALAYSANSAPVYTNHHAKVAYAPQQINYAAATPSYTYTAAPATHTEAYYPQQAQRGSHQNYEAHQSAQPVNQHIYAAAPSAVLSKTAYAAPPVYQIAQAAPISHSAAPPAAYSHAAPSYNYAAYPHTAVAPAAAHQSIVKIAYSPASEVAHLTYSNVNDHANYAW